MGGGGGRVWVSKSKAIERGTKFRVGVGMGGGVWGFFPPENLEI